MGAIYEPLPVDRNISVLGADKGTHPVLDGMADMLGGFTQKGESVRAKRTGEFGSAVSRQQPAAGSAQPSPFGKMEEQQVFHLRHPDLVCRI
jgi:hypothetical protein